MRRAAYRHVWLRLDHSKTIGFVAALSIESRGEQSAQAFARVFDCFAGFDRGEFRFQARAILHFLPVEREDFGFAAVLYLLVEAAAGFVTEPAAFEHFCR